MKFLKLGVFSITLGSLFMISYRFVSRYQIEYSENLKIQEIASIVTSEVQTGSMQKALETSHSLYELAFPHSPHSVQIKERDAIYGAGTSSSKLSTYRQVIRPLSENENLSLIFYVQKVSVLTTDLWRSILFISVLSFAVLCSLGWMIKRITIVTHRRFNAELQSALDLSTEGPSNGVISQFFDNIVKGGRSGKNLRKSVQNLKEKIVEANNTKITTQIQLEQNRKYIEVVRQVRHDLRSPLQMLIALSEKDLDAPTIQKHLNSAIFSFHGLIEDLEIKEEMVDASKNGEKPHVTEALIKEVIQQKRLVYETTSINLKINSSFLSVVHLNPHHFRRVIGNLLQNAQDAIQSSGKSSGHIAIETSQENGKLHISITDNGCGIPSDIQSKLFVTGFSYQKPGGSGLGLSHAKSCIERWGGEISMQSSLAGGAVVQISLPLALTEACFISTIPSEQVQVHLIIDDVFEDFERVQKSLSNPSIYCPNIKDFYTQYQTLPNSENVQVIFDYSLRESRTGLDILRELPATQKRVLYTNDYDHPDVIAASCDGIYVLPKVFLN